MNYLYCTLGIIGIAAVTYRFFKRIMLIVPFIIAGFAIYFAVQDVESGKKILETVFPYGLLVGISSIPTLLMVEFNSLKDRIKQLEEKNKNIHNH
jgi:hypothetical protein